MKTLVYFNYQSWQLQKPDYEQLIRLIIVQFDLRKTTSRYKLMNKVYVRAGRLAITPPHLVFFRWWLFPALMSSFFSLNINFSNSFIRHLREILEFWTSIKLLQETVSSAYFVSVCNTVQYTFPFFFWIAKIWRDSLDCATTSSNNKWRKVKTKQRTPSIYFNQFQKVVYQPSLLP